MVLLSASYKREFSKP